MLTKHIVLILNSALLMQYTLGNVITTETVTSASTKPTEIAATNTTFSPNITPDSVAEFAEEKLYYDRVKALFRVIDEFYFFTYAVIRSGRTIFEAVIADVRLSKAVGENKELDEKIELMEKFNQQVDNFFPREDYHFSSHLEMLEQFVNLLKSFNVTAMEKLSNVDLILNGSLNKHNFQAIKQDLGAKFVVYLEKLIKKVDAFKASMQFREQAGKEKINEWILELNELVTKIELYSRFFNEQ